MIYIVFIYIIFPKCSTYPLFFAEKPLAGCVTVRLICLIFFNQLNFECGILKYVFPFLIITAHINPIYFRLWAFGCDCACACARVSCAYIYALIII